MINLIIWLLAIATFFTGVVFGIGVAESKHKKVPVINDERLNKRLANALRDYAEIDLKADLRGLSNEE